MSTYSFKKAIDNGAGGTKVIPSDEYRCQVEHGKSKDSKKGDPGVLVRLRVKSGPHSGTPLFVQYTFSDAAIWKFFQDAPALGLDEEYLATDPTPEEIGKRLVDTQPRVIATVTVSDFRGGSNNVDQLVVDKTANIGAGEPEPTPDDEPSSGGGAPSPFGDDEEPF